MKFHDHRCSKNGISTITLEYMIFKGSGPSKNFQDCKLRYLGSKHAYALKIRLCVIFDSEQNDHKNFPIFDFFK